MSTFVSVGNAKQPFSRLLDHVRASVPELPAPVFVQHGHTPWQTMPGVESSAFLSMEDFAQRVQSAQVVILHAGAGSVIHALRAGKIPILVPRRPDLAEHIDNHQSEFARELAAAGKVVLFNDNTGFGVAVRQARQLQAQLATATMMPPLIQMVAERLRRPLRPR